MPILRKIEPPVEPQPIHPSDVAQVHLLDVLVLTKKPRSLTETPKIGDVVRLQAPPDTPDEQLLGIITQVSVRRDGVWTHVELLMHDQTRKVSKSTVAEIVGRPRGISRIDQDKKQLQDRIHGATHGWFVRLYEGKQHRVSAMFSDSRYGGVAESLKAALLFYTRETRPTNGQI